MSDSQTVKEKDKLQNEIRQEIEKSLAGFLFLFTARKRKRARVKNKLLHAYFIFGKDVNIVARKKTKRLRYEDRVIIERMSKAGKKVADIANEIGVHRDTIYKEFTRCGATKETYSAEKAQREI